ncbi:MAG: DNA polymerase I, partial [Candidatus Eisenbacteria bacterium]
DQEKPDYWALAWDSELPTRRHVSYPEYKAHRPPMPEDLVRQLPQIQSVARALGLPVIEVPGTEADDVMATLTRRAVAEDMDVVLVTNDKDLQQLVTPHVTVLAPGGGGKDDVWMDEAAVQAKWGVPPSGLRDVLALMGDSSDNIPGVPGVGEKTAVDLIAQFGSLDALYARLPEVKRDSLRLKLFEHRDRAFESQDLVKVDDDLPIREPWQELSVQPIEGPRLAALAQELGLARLARYAGEAAKAAGAAPAATTEAAEPEVAPAPETDAGQLGFGFDASPASAPLPRPARAGGAPAVSAGAGDELPAAFGPPVRIVTDPAELRALVERLAALPSGFAIDTETTSEDPLKARLVGVGLSWGEAPVYLPIAHAGGPNLPLEAFETAFAPLLADPRVPKIGQHFKYDQLVLRGAGLAVAGLACDTMVASYLLDPETPHNLDFLARTHLGVEKIPTSALLGKRGKDQTTMDLLPVPLVAAYCGEDAHVTWLLAEQFVPQLVAQGQAALFRDVEIPLSDVLADMEWEGVALDAPFLAAMSTRITEEIAGLEKRIHDVAGKTFNIQSTQQLGEILFGQLGLPGGRKTKTGFSTDSEVLEELATRHDLPRLVLQYRQLTKLKSTYVDALPALVLPRDGRLHTSFHQTVAATGRLSSSDPNLQNIPFRTPLGREVRRAFVARPGWKLVSADYSQVELRLMAHLSRDPALVDAFARGEDVHARTAQRVFGLPGSQAPTAEQRAMAKVVNFGVMYGMGSRSLARQLGIPVPEATKFIDEYYRTHEGVKRYLEGEVESARAKGYSETILGRRRALPALTQSNGLARSIAERAAINAPIQGSAADLIKVAMVRLARDLEARGLAARLVLQVHDELLVECPVGELEVAQKAVVEAMTHAMQLSVPLEVQVGAGDNWFEVHG